MCITRQFIGFGANKGCIHHPCPNVTRDVEIGEMILQGLQPVPAWRYGLRGPGQFIN